MQMSVSLQNIRVHEGLPLDMVPEVIELLREPGLKNYMFNALHDLLDNIIR